MLRIWDSKATESHSSRIMCKGKDHLKKSGHCISLNLPLPLRTNPSPLTGIWQALVLSRSVIASCFPLSLFVGLRSHAHTYQVHRYFWFFPFGRHLCFFFPSLKFSFPAHCMTKGLHWTKMYILKRTLSLSLGGLFLPPFIDWSCPLQHIGLWFLSIIYYTFSVNLLSNEYLIVSGIPGPVWVNRIKIWVENRSRKLWLVEKWKKSA